MPANDPEPPLLGRRGECEALLRLLDGVRSGHSAVLVVRGEAGIGKTALLDFVSNQAQGCQVARAAGVEPEMELPFAGLHQLCVPFLDRAQRLPAPQRDALATAFGLSAAPAPDRFLVGLAALSLLADAAGDRPLICLVDDAHWLDRVSAQTVAFVARRLFAEPIGLVIATRTQRDPDLRGLPELALSGLDPQAADALLDSVLPGRVDASIRNRLIAETGGNPLALLELPRSLGAAGLAGRMVVPDARPVAAQIEDGFASRIAELPAEARRLLLVAAIEPSGDVALLWQAAERLGIPTQAAGPVVAGGLLSLDTGVRFRHPLLRSAVYRAAGIEERQQVHRALAEVTDPNADPDRRAWHRAQATMGPDEEVAAELEASAARARQRGGVSAEAAFLERATALTPQPRLRAERALAAARARLRAGSADGVLDLLAVARDGPLSELDRARLDLVRAQARFAADRGHEAAPLLLAAARNLEPLDPALARETYLEAISAAMFAGRLAGAVDVEVVARSARSAPAATMSSELGDRLLNGLAALFTDGYRKASPVGKTMLQSMRASGATADELRYLWLAAAAAADLFDDDSWRNLADDHVRIARELGALTELPLALNSKVMVHLFAGELGAAASLVAEIATLTESTGTDLAGYGAMGLAALQGDEPTARALIEANVADVTARGEGIAVTSARWSSALLHNGAGRFEQALPHAVEAALDPRELAVANWGLAELVEAAAKVGDTALAADAVQRLSEMTSASGTDWARGVEARSRGLVVADGEADALFRESVTCLRRTRMVLELARAHLLYGEWLHAQNRKREAQRQLRTAHYLFEAMGAQGFTERSRRVLRATGATVTRRTQRGAAGAAVEGIAALTAQEAQIARLAGAGLTNPEIGAQLFLSPHTVEWHLRKVFVKLGIRSRRQLPELLAGETTPAALA